MVLRRPVELAAVTGEMVFTCPIVRISATSSELLVSTRKSVYFRTGKARVAAHPGLRDNGERVQFSLAITYACQRNHRFSEVGGIAAEDVSGYTLCHSALQFSDWPSRTHLRLLRSYRAS